MFSLVFPCFTFLPIIERLRLILSSAVTTRFLFAIRAFRSIALFSFLRIPPAQGELFNPIWALLNFALCSPESILPLHLPTGGFLPCAELKRPLHLKLQKVCSFFFVNTSRAHHLQICLYNFRIIQT
jgi:hypothetical protein